jgi:hypothetical protein
MRVLLAETGKQGGGAGGRPAAHLKRAGAAHNIDALAGAEHHGIARRTAHGNGAMDHKHGGPAACNVDGPLGAAHSSDCLRRHHLKATCVASVVDNDQDCLATQRHNIGAAIAVSVIQPEGGTRLGRHRYPVRASENLTPARCILDSAAAGLGKCCSRRQQKCRKGGCGRTAQEC